MYWSLTFNFEYCPQDKLWGPEISRGKHGGYVAFGFGAAQVWISWS